MSVPAITTKDSMILKFDETASLPKGSGVSATDFSGGVVIYCANIKAILILTDGTTGISAGAVTFANHVN